MAKSKRSTVQTRAKKNDAPSRYSRKVAEAIDARRKTDGWSNVLTGLGKKSKDARQYSKVEWRLMTEHEVEHLYAGDAMAAKIVDKPVVDSLETGYTIGGISKEQEKRLKAELKRLKFDTTIAEAAKKGRLYGGAVILKVYSDDLRLETPAPNFAGSSVRVTVNPDGSTETKTAQVPIKSLVILNRYELYCTWEDVNKDVLSPDFGNPLLYTFCGRAGSSTANMKIHASRLVRFDGAWLPDYLRQRNGFWHDTVLSRPFDAIRNYADAHDGVSAALKDLSVAVFKIRDLAEQISADADSMVLDRMSLVNATKSIARAVVLDAEGEDFDYKTRTLTGAGELIDRIEQRLAAEVSMPQTVLFGQSPRGGLGQSGNHEADNWHSTLDAWRNDQLKPQMLDIIREVAASLGIDTKDLDLMFNPLAEMSEKEIVEMRNKQATTDTMYITNGVLDPSEVRDSRFGGDKYTTETKIDPNAVPAPLDLTGGDDPADDPDDQDKDKPNPGGKDPAEKKGKDE